MLAAIAATAETALVTGLPLGAVIVARAGWRAIFLVNIPLAVAHGAAAVRWLPR